MARTGAKPRPVEERFWRFVSPCPNTGCWWWTGATQRKGYGHIGGGGRGAGNIVASRLSYALHNGAVPDDKFVCHRCDNPSCVNPDHLFLGTNRDNMQDCKKKGRTRGGQRGETHGNATIANDVVRQIRVTAGTCAEVGRRFGMSASNAYNIRSRKTWKHVE